MKKIELAEIGSTNDYAKSLAAGREDAVVTALRQTGGKGRKGRSFESEEGGLYLSLLRFYEKFPASRAFEIMRGSCLAVRRTLAGFGISADIKWPNDVLVGGRKICGILIETGLVGSLIDYAVIGIGINVNNRLSAELGGTAASMREILGKRVPLGRVRENLIADLFRAYTAEEYRAALVTLGREVTVSGADGEYRALATDVAEDGRLVVVRDGNRLLVSAGDVTVRTKEGA